MLDPLFLARSKLTTRDFNNFHCLLARSSEKRGANFIFQAVWALSVIRSTKAVARAHLIGGESRSVIQSLSTWTRFGYQQYRAKSRRGRKSCWRRNVDGDDLIRAGCSAFSKRVGEQGRTAVFMVLEGLKGPNSLGNSTSFLCDCNRNTVSARWTVR